jgi:hypothetical protein
MPKMTNKSEDSTVETKTTVESSKDEIISMLMKKVEALTDMVNELSTTKDTSVEQAVVEDTSESEYAEPSPNKQIRLISLCYGCLNLSTEPFGKGKLITFSKYGESKTILYSTLIDIVNNNRKFAENGAFYILDKDAVYYLGLTDYYKGILSKDIMDNIYDYSATEISSLLESATDEQKEVLVRNAIDSIYNNKPIDLNKCDIIGKAYGVNIMDKVSEMRQIDDAMNKSK